MYSLTVYSILIYLFLPFCWSAFLENGVVGVPEIECMEDRMKLRFRTKRPFTGRIFVKGMVDKDNCVNSFIGNVKTEIQFEMINGQCNMRRSRKLGPDEKGVEQSIAIIISFHDTFITKIDRAYRCTCFYMEADRVVTSRFDVSVLPTTDLVDTARMPVCAYTVHRGSINGPTVSFVTVGEPLFHVWHCESDMFAILVHSCFVDDGNGQEKKPLIDEHGCAIDSFIVPDLTYNNANNMAFAEVNAFKFADKVTTYFQCAVSTCMRSEGMCEGRTPPRCGYNRPQDNEPEEVRTTERVDKRRKVRQIIMPVNRLNKSKIFDEAHTMDLSTEKIVVLDLEEKKPNDTELETTYNKYENGFSERYSWIIKSGTQICLNATTATVISAAFGFLVMVLITIVIAILLRRKLKKLPL